jgi:hypothetical protein
MAFTHCCARVLGMRTFVPPAFLGTVESQDLPFCFASRDYTQCVVEVRM